MPASTPSSGARGVVSTFTLWRLLASLKAKIREGAADVDGETGVCHALRCCLLNVAAEIGLADARIGPHLCGRTFHEFSSLLHHQRTVGDQKRATHVLLHH